MLSRRTIGQPKSSGLSFLPDYIADSVADIDFAALKQAGIQACFIDLDGTVVERGTFEVSDRIRQVLQDCGIDIYIATNRPKSRDLRNLKLDVHAAGVIHPAGLYGKPAKRYFRAALREYSLQNSKAVMIGDRYFQDIFGANGAGVYSLLVRKIGRPASVWDRMFSKAEDLVTVLLARRYK